jgi:[ribosomal protein S5]-alanine N-acetyltransferase
MPLQCPLMQPLAQPELLTPRLRLAPFTLADAPDVFSYARDPQVSKYTTWRTHESLQDAEDYLRSVLARAPGDYCWAIRLRDDPTVIGAIECSHCLSPTAEIHYVLASSHWNRGFMTEAFAAVMSWAFTHHPHIECIRTRAVAENIGSRRVMEKCGLVFERFRTDRWEKLDQQVTQAEYAIARDNWAQNQSQFVNSFPSS